MAQVLAQLDISSLRVNNLPVHHSVTAKFAMSLRRQRVLSAVRALEAACLPRYLRLFTLWRRLAGSGSADSRARRDHHSRMSTVMGAFGQGLEEGRGGEGREEARCGGPVLTR
jgi:hypothetical protein